MERHTVALIFVAVLSAGSFLSSGMLILKHARCQDSHGAHKYTMRILFMAPVYSLQAWLALLLRATQGNEAMELLRKGYECITIFAFTQLLVCQLGGVAELCAHLTSEQCAHLPPVKCLVHENSWTPPSRFVNRSLTCVLQFVPVSLTCAMLGFFTWPVQELFEVVQPLCNGIVLASQAVAMYGLIVFYHANGEQLAPIRPVTKLLAIKVLLFFTMWQTLCLHIASERFHAFRRLHERSTSGWSERQICDGILNGLLVGEMFLLSLAHHCIYPTCDEAVDQADGPTRACWHLAQVWDFRDIPQFYRQLALSARTVSTDSLLAEPTPRRWCCYLSNFFRSQQQDMQ